MEPTEPMRSRDRIVVRRNGDDPVADIGSAPIGIGTAAAVPVPRLTEAA